MSVSSSSPTGVAEELVYRPLDKVDREEIERLHLECFPVRYSSSFYDDAVVGEHTVRDYTGPIFSLLAVKEGVGEGHKIAGAIISQFQPACNYTQYDLLDDTTKYPMVSYILTLASTSSYRRQGIATKLLSSCLSHANSNRRCGAVYLHVITYNQAAMNFYSRHGFKRVGTLMDYYFIDGKNYNAYLYVKYVNGAVPPRSMFG
eukprot:CAMPEP_0118637818 /NCGR_PEP_ID=MMETSP0785-20121206/3353_1 /TAXON_ID=91992 /ORGANISM="Bolidomonas pacifica, Strain CCMP 1866" /LENGTH=202 /DNA_ID=CAMNT_0006529025 /DNA_START=102 /DNA_END=707 /DNA_ORIENTATION=-